MSNEKKQIEGLERYNHISDGGFFCRSYIEGNGQFLEVGLSNYGIATKTTIFLNKHVIDSLFEVLTDAAYQRNIHNLDVSGSYVVNTPGPDRSKQSYKDNIDEQVVSDKECPKACEAKGNPEKNNYDANLEDADPQDRRAGRDDSGYTLKDEIHNVIDDIFNFIKNSAIAKYTKK